LSGLKERLEAQKSSLKTLTASSHLRPITGTGDKVVISRISFPDKKSSSSRTLFHQPRRKLMYLKEHWPSKATWRLFITSRSEAQANNLAASIRANNFREKYESNAIKRARELAALEKDRGKFSESEYKMLQAGSKSGMPTPKRQKQKPQPEIKRRILHARNYRHCSRS
jgi:hypothetical protein